jgi:hypothetical protein
MHTTLPTRTSLEYLSYYRVPGPAVRGRGPA